VPNVQEQPEAVAAIARAVLDGSPSNRELARMFGTSEAAIRRAKKSKSLRSAVSTEKTRRGNRERQRRAREREMYEAQGLAPPAEVERRAPGGTKSDGADGHNPRLSSSPGRWQRRSRTRPTFGE
jgi:hypothetical protein